MLERVAACVPRARGPREVEVGLPSQASEGAPPFSPASPHRWVTLRIAALTTFEWFTGELQAQRLC